MKAQYTRVWHDLDIIYFEAKFTLDDGTVEYEHWNLPASTFEKDPENDAKQAMKELDKRVRQKEKDAARFAQVAELVATHLLPLTEPEPISRDKD